MPPRRHILVGGSAATLARLAGSDLDQSRAGAEGCLSDHAVRAMTRTPPQSGAPMPVLKPWWQRFSGRYLYHLVQP